MKIERYTGGSYPNKYDDGKPDYYLAHVREMERSYGVKFSDIDTVTIGNASYPITTITFSDGLELIDEIVSTPFWCGNENQQRINEWSK